MIRRIRLQNFMSHADTVLELAEGLTVLTGPNNSGKSAVVEALGVLCYNAAGDFMVRHGQTECAVEVETDDGHTIRWQRKKATVSYTIDGEDFHRLGRGVPDKLHEVLRLPMVETAKEPFDVHFGRQKSPIFLLDEPGSRAAMFFASSSDAAALLEMQRLHRTKVRDAKRDTERLASEVEVLDRRLQQLEPCDALDVRISRLEVESQAIMADWARIESLNQLLADRAQRESAVARGGAELASLAPLTSPPRVADERPLRDLIDRLDAAHETARRCRQRWDCLCDVPAKLELTPTDPLADCIDRIASAGEHHAKCQRTLGALERLAEAPPLERTEEIAQCTRALADATNQTTLRDRVVSQLRELTSPPELVDDAPVTDSIAAIAASTSTVEKISARVWECNRDRDEIEAAIRRWAVDTDACPTCGAELDADRLISQATAPVRETNHG